MKEYNFEVSVVARITSTIEADSLEEAKKKLFDAGMELKLVNNDGQELCRIEYDWHMVDKARQDNVQESDLSDFEIYEEEE